MVSKSLTSPFQLGNINWQTPPGTISFIDSKGRPEGVFIIRVRLGTEFDPSEASPLRISWTIPLIGVSAIWFPGKAPGGDFLPPEWSGATRLECSLTGYPPVVCALAANGGSCLTFAVGECVHPVVLTAGVHEETSSLNCAFQADGSLLRGEGVLIRLDLRDIDFVESVRDTVEWWDSTMEKPPMDATEAARRPMYSTWYSFHQNLVPEEVERECLLAHHLGCSAVILDDGWQTLDSLRGYAHCGDWRPLRIPEMARHVERIHAIGLKALLWYSVPFVGRESAAYARFKGKYLSGASNEERAVLDPRFPEVRSYLTDLYVEAVECWGFDGLKLDFIDSFRISPAEARETGDGRDIASLEGAIRRLLQEVLDRVRAVRPEAMIEFRQTYFGPAIRRFANILRAADCPNDAGTNRIRTTELRLLSGRTPVHSDMLMWNQGETVERAALQLLNVLFSVPQISVRLASLNPGHQAMLRFWLRFWNDHRACLLDGRFFCSAPQTGFRLVGASTVRETILVNHDCDAVVPFSNNSEVWIVNATHESRITLRSKKFVDGRMRIFDTCGCLQSEGLFTLTGLADFPVPPSGLIHVQCNGPKG